MVFDKPDKSHHLDRNTIGIPNIDTVTCWKCKGEGQILKNDPLSILMNLPTPQGDRTDEALQKYIRDNIGEECPICKGKRYIRINSDILEVYYE